MTENKLKKLFQKAVRIKVPQNQGKSKGYGYDHWASFVFLENHLNILKLFVILHRFAFVEFASVADAEKALKLTQNMKIYKREARIQFCDVRENPDSSNGK